MYILVFDDKLYNSMNIVIDLASAEEFLNNSIFWFGWIPIAFVLLWGFKELWMVHIQNQWGAKNGKYMLLAIDIPKDNMQSPKAVESLFCYLAGAHGGMNLVEKYWDGKYQLSFSFEIVSIEGYTQFLIWTPIIFRNLVESAVYSQYPDAEITEVDDYTTGFPKKFPDDKYDIWGSEFIQTAPAAYPIRTYSDFEYQFGEPETQFKDPLSVLMDLNSSLGPGEQLWYQIILGPTDFEWVKNSDKEVKKILGENVSSSPNLVVRFIDGVLNFLQYVFNSIIGNEGGVPSVASNDTLKMMDLKPNQKKIIEGIEAKSSKIGFNTKIRMIYLSEKETMQKSKVVNGFVGFIKQFGDSVMNGFKPDADMTATVAAYFYVESRINKRKTKLINNYMNRSGVGGRRMGLLNVEELATLWHFPIEAVTKAPLIQKAPGRKAKPPTDLPISFKEDAKSAVPEFLKGNMEQGDMDEEIYEDEKEILNNNDTLVDLINKDKDAILTQNGDVTRLKNNKNETKDVNKETDNELKKVVKKEVVKSGEPPSNLPIGN